MMMSAKVRLQRPATLGTAERGGEGAGVWKGGGGGWTLPHGRVFVHEQLNGFLIIGVHDHLGVTLCSLGGACCSQGRPFLIRVCILTPWTCKPSQDGASVPKYRRDCLGLHILSYIFEQIC